MRGRAIIQLTHAAPIVLSDPGQFPAVIEQFALSPGGNRLAEVVEPLGREAGKVQIIVRNLREETDGVRHIYSGAPVSDLQWVNDRRVLYVTSGAVARVITEDVSSRDKVVLLRQRGGISGIVYDRKSGLFAYEYAKKWRWGDRVSVRMKPSMDVEELMLPRWSVGRMFKTYLGLGRSAGLSGGRENGNRLHVQPFREVVFNQAPALLWRHGQLLAIEPAAHSNYGTHLVDAFTGKVINAGAPLFSESKMAVSRTGRIAVIGRPLWRNGHKAVCGCNGSAYLYVFGTHGIVHDVSALSRHQLVLFASALWWVGRDRLIVQVLSSSGSRRDDFDGPLRWRLVKVDWRTNRVVRTFQWPNGDLGDQGFPCSLDTGGSEAVCVAQTLTMPPRLVELNTATGKMRNIGEINPTERPLPFRFMNVKVSAAYGASSTGFLALPSGAQEEPVPLAVMLYGFDEEYSRHAQWITSYPVAKLVHSGIAVLLLNWAYIPGLSQSYEESKHVLRGALATIANAVPAVKARGVRVSRAMVMGWSFGGLFVSHAIQDLREYVAAQVGDPAAYNTMAYALYDNMWSQNSDMWFGGPPIRRYMSHYLRFDPSADGRAANGPILLEFVSDNFDAGQYIREWHAVGTDVEAFAYRRSVHWLNVPAEAAVSKLRNLYWAKMNLFGPRSVSCAELRNVDLTVPKAGWWNRPSAARARHEVSAAETCRSSG